MNFLGFGNTNYDKVKKRFDKLEKRKDVKKLIKALYHKDKFFRRRSIEILLRLKNTESIDPLVDIALHDDDFYVRNDAVSALEQFGGAVKDKHYKTILNILKNDDDITSKERALSFVNSVGNIDSRFTDVLVKFLDSNEEGVQILAAQCLRHIKDPKVIEPLRNALNTSVRGNALWSLSMLTPFSLEVLNEVMYDESPNSYKDREVAAKALAETGLPALEYLVAALDHFDYEVRFIALQELEKINFIPRNQTENINYLFSKHFYHGSLSFNFNDKLEEFVKLDVSSIKLVVNKMSHHDWEIARLAAEALEKMSWNPKSLSEEVTYYIAKEDLENLSSLGDHAIEELKNALTHKSHKVQDIAAKALCKFNNKKVIEPILDYKFKSLRGDGDWYWSISRDISVAHNLFGDYTEIISKIFTWSESCAYDHLYVKEDTESALNKLCSLNTNISNNILHYLSKLKDVKGTVSGRDAGIVVDYSDHIEKANLELKSRGNPPYDPSVFLSEEEWIIQTISDK